MAPRRIIMGLTTALVVQLAVASGGSAATVTVVNNDAAGEGFNDPTAATPVAGNPGTTLGQQRLNAFQAAADAWGAILTSSVEVRVGAQMNPLAPCGPTSGVLGAAGPTTAHRDFTGAPRPNTWYVQAMANSIAGSDLAPGTDDVAAQFNSDVDDNPNCLTGLTWWYGVGAAAPANTISFYDVVLHEIGHGIGMLSLVAQNGVRFNDIDDIYMSFLEDHSTGLGWPDMTNAQRAASAVDTGDLHWTGAGANACAEQILTAGFEGGHTRIYAPNPFQGGSSVSHWDTALTPDELMEPFATPSPRQDITNQALADMGWTVTAQCGAVAATCETVWNSTNPVPFPEFGQPYDVFEPSDLLLDASCTGDTAQIVVGKGDSNQLIWRDGYEWRDGRWQPFALTGDELLAGRYYRGQATADRPWTATEQGQLNYFIAKVCTWTGSRWACGCRDTACTQNLWQVQVYRVPPGGTVASAR